MQARETNPERACKVPLPGTDFPCHLQELKAKHPEIMQELLMDVLRVLSTPDMDIRRKTLNIALDLTTAQNIEEVGFCTDSDLKSSITSLAIPFCLPVD